MESILVYTNHLKKINILNDIFHIRPKKIQNKKYILNYQYYIFHYIMVLL